MSKLTKDFGVRALLATIFCVGVVASTLLIIVFFNQSGKLNLETALAVLAPISGGAATAIAFYFGTRSNNKEGQP